MTKITEYIESLIFSFGDGITLEELSKRTKVDPLIVKKAAASLNKSYEERKAAFYILTEGNLYRMRLRSDLLFLVNDTLKTDMSKGILMTLSLIVLNGKISQAELVKRRGSISYQHIKELQSRGLVSTSKENGAKVVKVTPLFYDYFDVDKQEFKDIKDTIKEEVTKEDNTIEYKGN